MARVLAISSQTVFGPVGLSAAVPALKAEGHEVLALPTILLSHHPGHGTPAGQRTPAELMREMLEGLSRLGALSGVEAVLTGYFADAEQVRVAAEAIANLHARHVLVDPVIGDHGALYVPEKVADAIRDGLLPRATIITPNLFELQWLSGSETETEAVERLARAETLVTSAARSGGRIETRLHAAGRITAHASTDHPHVPHGTGDHLAGLYLAHRLSSDPPQAFARAMAALDRAVAASAGQAALQVAHVTKAR